MKLSEIIRDYRQRSQESLDTLAKNSGLSKGYISMLEKDKNSSNGKPIKPTLDTLQKLAVGMNMPLDNLLAYLANQLDDYQKDEPIKHYSTNFKEDSISDSKDLHEVLENLRKKIRFNEITNCSGKPIDYSTRKILIGEIIHLQDLADMLTNKYR